MRKLDIWPLYTNNYAYVHIHRSSIAWLLIWLLQAKEVLPSFQPSMVAFNPSTLGKGKGVSELSTEQVPGPLGLTQRNLGGGAGVGSDDDTLYNVTFRSESLKDGTGGQDK